MSPTITSQLEAYADVLDHHIDTHVSGATPPIEPDTGAPASGRHRRLLLLGAMAVAATVAVVAFAGFGGAQPAAAWAGWTATSTATPDPAAVANLDEACRASGLIDDRLPVLAVDVRGSGGAAVYADDAGWATCQADSTASDGFEVTSIHSNVGSDLVAARAAVAAGQPVVTVAAGWRGDPPASMVWGIRRSSLESITVTTGATDVEAALAGEVWVAWWPDDGAETSVLRAIDADGTMAASGGATEFAPPLPAVASILDAVAQNGTEAERRVLADGRVTWPELQAALDEWVDCVEDAGHELTIELDHERQTYRALSGVVSVPAAEGQPDDLRGEALLRPAMETIESCLRQHVSRIERVWVQQ